MIWACHAGRSLHRHRPSQINCRRMCKGRKATDNCAYVPLSCLTAPKPHTGRHQKITKKTIGDDYAVELLKTNNIPFEKSPEEKGVDTEKILLILFVLVLSLGTCGMQRTRRGTSTWRCPLCQSCRPGKIFSSLPRRIAENHVRS